MDPELIQMLLQFQLRDILVLAFVEGMLPDMGAHLHTRKEPQATRELWEVSLHEGVPFLGCLCLVGSLLGRTTVPYLRQSSFIFLSQKKIWT